MLAHGMAKKSGGSGLSGFRTLGSFGSGWSEKGQPRLVARSETTFLVGPKTFREVQFTTRGSPESALMLCVDALAKVAFQGLHYAKTGVIEQELNLRIRLSCGSKGWWTVLVSNIEPISNGCLYGADRFCRNNPIPRGYFDFG